MKSKLERQRELLARLKRPVIEGVSADFAVTTEEALAGFYTKKRPPKAKAKSQEKPGKKRKKKARPWFVAGSFENGKRR
ncbi:hypothetical protein [Pseudomonas nitroreducens]|uniref:hypothetical protein n=1 Tax=Pseudomonas nitroreducens TaxID=46680 RepID=UPI002D802B29|nr:hypothetical protein [Pseudomonas nitroreducens]